MTNDSADAAPTIRGDRGATVLGPDNEPIGRQNPGAPPTDSGSLPNLKFSFGAAHNRLLDGGWAREVTVRELPVATTLAGVNMRLKRGAYRELHWHREAEWAFMLAGSARIAAIDPQGRNFVDDIGPGDLWNFKAGFPHSIQALEDCEFLLVFDNGSFSENETFLVSDWFTHTPKHVLAKNFGVAESAFDNLPTDIEHTRYIFPGEVPGALVADIEAARSPAGAAERMSHRLLAQDPVELRGGTVRVVDSTNFPAASTIAAAYVELQPGAMREMHWHPNNDEWQYWISGHVRMTVFGSSGTARTFDYRAGDVGYVPRAMGHYFENLGDEPARMLELFKSDHFSDVSLNQWLGLTPAEVVGATLNLDRKTLAALRKDKPLIVE
ncbi:cupin domain-containing protein [Mycobacterium shigaense]|uniref:Oxalate decarboxylase OxdC n=1 Tax=Mycobacterium shigaense TaxID=722731 RepID=A0A1Z4EJM0_9MYCO|nr:cupin domain-containing protein [Mycobacterium shigaense]PRI15666.1 oxalate decarboxylase [Mycobacterium shigaense]BAX93173.1 oxalate decarboxylase OxdC [Mycobacterium shigaense]